MANFHLPSPQKIRKRKNLSVDFNVSQVLNSHSFQDVKKFFKR